MKKLLLTGLGVLPLFLSAVSLEQTGNDFKVTAKDYAVTLSKANGYVIEINKIGNTKLLYGRATPKTELDADWEKYRSAYNPPPEMLNRNHLKPVCKVAADSKEEVKLEISWNFPGGSTKETITFNDTPAINYSIDIDHNVRIYSHTFHLAVSRAGNDGIFLPDGVRAKGVWHGFGDMKMGKTWQSSWYPSKKVGFGIALPENNVQQGLEYAMQGIHEGQTYEISNMNAVFSALSTTGKNGKKNFKYTLLLADDPEMIRKEAEKVAGTAPEIEIYSYEAEKFLTKPGEKNSLSVQLRNNGSKKESVTLKTNITHGLNSKIKLDDVKVTLDPGEKKEIRIPVTYPASVSKGLAFTTELFDSKGNLLDTEHEFCSVTKFSSRDALVGVVNAAQGNKDGTETIWAKCFRKKYVGTFNYYCWAHSMIFGLVPPTDPWVPRTEANYTEPISKKFLKGMISTAHEKGVNVYAMLTGLWNYDVAVEHPEWMQYCKDGQPWIYNGTLYNDGSRRLIVKANAFTEERAAIMGNEMADCIDFFGFDGCRWDWNFIPNANNDPLLADTGAADWYDYNGVPSRKLYPDPDTTAQKALSAWRKAVNKRHPDFIYGTNYTTSEQNLTLYPKYFKELSTNSLVLFEDMLDYAEKENNTFEKWGTELAKRTDKVRENGGTVIVGWMRGTNPGTVAYELANYVSSSAGAKWFQSYQFHVKSYSDIIRNRYFARYADYYYNPEFLRNDKAGISQVNSDRILWKPFMRERKKDGFREIVIPMVNLPKEDYICQYHDAPALKNPVFAITPAKGEKIDSVWVMDPLDPVEAKQIKVSGNQFKIENLKESVMVLVRLKGK